MNFLVQRGKVRSQVINVPDGLPEILSDITREVLRCQPAKECLCQFIIDYLHSVIVARDKALLAKKMIERALRAVDEIISDMCICDIPKEKGETMALIMEECFKNFITKRRCEVGREQDIVKFSEIDVLDEMIKKCNFTESELNISRPVIEAAYDRFIETYQASQDNTESTEALYKYFRDRELERVIARKKNMAAIKIQSMFRGFLVRRTLLDSTLFEEDDMTNIEELKRVQDAAARKIQEFFHAQISLKKHKTEVETLVEIIDDFCHSESKISMTAHKPGEIKKEAEPITKTEDAAVQAPELATAEKEAEQSHPKESAEDKPIESAEPPVKAEETEGAQAKSETGEGQAEASAGASAEKATESAPAAEEVAAEPETKQETAE